jgi:hypothetical protein
MQALRQTRRVALEDVRTNNNQFQTPQLTFSASDSSCASIFGLEVERSGEILEISAKILNRAMAEMLLTHCLNVLEGEIPDVYLSCLTEIVKVVLIGFPPLLCFGGCLGWHLAEMGRPELSCVVWLVGKNDKSAN